MGRLCLTLSPAIAGFFLRVNFTFNMTVLHTLTKKLDGDRQSTWRFVEIEGTYCAIGGNYKLVSYRSEAAMKKSIAWFASKGYATV